MRTERQRRTVVGTSETVADGVNAVNSLSLEAGLRFRSEQNFLSGIDRRAETVDAPRLENRLERRHWRRVEEVFQAVVDAESGDAAACLANLTRGQEALRRDVESLLVAYHRADTVLAEIHPRGSGPWVGHRFGAYTVLGELGRGGMSTVLLAARADEEYQRLVALKVLGSAVVGDDLQQRFRRERQILASLDHPNIARLYDGDTTPDGLPFFAMEYVEGLRIDHFCDHHRLSIPERLHLFQQVCQAVDFAHRNLVVHRDLKASNILVTADGVPKLLDFGIAKLLDPGSFPMAVEPTRTGLRPMTLAYASPEQACGGAISTASDVYSLGLLLFELLVGHPPYRLEGLSSQDAIRVVLHRQPAKMSSLVTDEEAEKRGTTAPRLQRLLKGDLETIVAYALAKEPERRYLAPQQLTGDLACFLKGHPVSARRDTLGYRAKKFLRRHRWATAAGLAAGALAITFLVLQIIQHRATERQRQRAEEVTEMMIEIFSLADPTEALGERITARELLDRGQAQVEKDLQSEPELLAEMLDTIGQAYHGLGLYDQAHRVLSAGLALRRGQRRPEPSALAASHLHLGRVLRVQGEYPAASGHLQQALNLTRRSRGDRTEQVLEVTAALAESLRYEGRFEQARELVEAALLSTRTTGATSPHRARLLGEAGALAADRGDLATAESFLRRELELLSHLFEPPHPGLSLAHNELALVLENTGEYRGAERHYRQALAMDRALYEDGHPELASTLFNLGNVLARLGDFTAAEPLYREGLEIDRQTLGEDHPYYATSLSGLASLLAETHGAVSAEPLLRRALEIELAALGADHPELAFTYNNLGVALRDQGRYEPARVFLEKALAAHQRHGGETHLEVGNALRNLAVLDLQRVQSGEADDAAPALREADRQLQEASSILVEALGENHRAVATVELHRAALLHLQGHFENAQKLLAKARETLSENLGANHPSTLRADLLEAEMALDAGAPRAAETLARQVLEARPATPGEGLTANIASAVLGASLERQGRGVEARALLVPAAAWLAARQGELSLEARRARAALAAVAGPEQ